MARYEKLDAREISGDAQHIFLFPTAEEWDHRFAAKMCDLLASTGKEFHNQVRPNPPIDRLESNVRAAIEQSSVVIVLLPSSI